MKKITLYSLILSFFFVMGMYAADINVSASQDLKAIIRAANDGDVITLTDAAVYTLDSIKYVNSITIQAAGDLELKPVIRCLKDAGTNGKTQFYPKGGASLTFDGIVFDGNNSVYFWLTSQYDGLANVTVTNCDFINMKSPAGTGGIVFVAKKYDAASTMGTVAGSLSVTNCSFVTVNSGLMLCTTASYSSVEFKNCYVKGPLAAEAFSNTTTMPDFYAFDHITMDGCNYREFNTSSSISNTLSNIILANNTYTTKGLILGSGNLLTNCAVYNYSPAYASYIDKNTVRTNPVFDNNGIATSADYVNKGSDGKTIGYYDDGQIKQAATGVKSIKSSSFRLTQDEQKLCIIGDLAQNAPYKIFDIRGNKVLEGNVSDKAINIKSLTKGVYIVQLNNDYVKIYIQ